ncbi:hypothetical protein H0H87_007380 [Tephrocybe sp. NHM501043]|nr:hypothetical protein H0H87_007380 [Tephrocybe sp. NHM501043]
MAASLSAIPVDVLQDIGFLLAAFSLPQPPRCLVNLLLTCSSIHDALSVRACPQLYARIFRHTFDFDGSLHTRVPDSVLAVELCHRHRVLWRTRRMDLSSEPDHDELWGAMRLVLENDGRNSRLLATNNFYTFMMSYVLQRLSHAEATNLLPRSNDDTTSLAMWLLCLTLRRQDIVDTPKETRNILSKLLRFPTVHKDFRSVESPVDVSLDMVQDPAAAKGLMTDADRDNLLEKATPAIILIFALNEVVPMAIPSHVPETRAIAKATQRTGPTAEDFRAVNHGRTPLFSETKPPHTTGQNPAAVMSNPVHLALYQSRLSSFLYSTYMDSTYTPAYIYAPGFLSGLWEGSFMVRHSPNSQSACRSQIYLTAAQIRDQKISGEPIPTTTLHPLLLGQFRCLKPMQCAITEYLCFSPHSPIPLNYSLDLIERAVCQPEFISSRVAKGFVPR